MKNSTHITCPNCNTSIDVNDVLKHQLEENLRKEFQAKELKMAADLNEKQQALEAEKRALSQQKQEQEALFQERIEAEKKAAEQRIREELRKKVEEEQQEQLAALNKELTEKSQKLRELNKMSADLDRIKREKEELKEQLEAENERKLNEQMAQEKERIQKKVDEENEFKFAQLHKQLEDQKKLTEEMKRKQEQGSMQLQGEVQELAIETYLTTHFPLDTIEEVKKGANGADCVQVINTREVQNCGIICYESKRTKAFSEAWIPKFKADMQACNANIGVLITEVLPKDMQRMGMKDGVWICTFEEFKGLVGVLRQSLISINTALASQQNKGGKMELLYDFLISDAFRMQIEAIVSGFTAMKADLEKEKRAMQSQWKKREKNIELVTKNTIEMYGSIRGIAGNSMKAVESLELEVDVELLEE